MGEDLSWWRNMMELAKPQNPLIMLGEEYYGLYLLNLLHEGIYKFARACRKRLLSMQGVHRADQPFHFPEETQCNLQPGLGNESSPHQVAQKSTNTIFPFSCRRPRQQQLYSFWQSSIFLIYLACRNLPG